MNCHGFCGSNKRTTMKKYLPFLIFWLVSSSLMAQGLSTKSSPAAALIPGNSKITGIVKDSTTQQVVEFANIALIDVATNKPIDGAVCDVNGKFTLNKVADGNYGLAVSFIGYENKTVPLKVNGNDIDL